MTNDNENSEEGRTHVSMTNFEEIQKPSERKSRAGY